MYVIINHQLQYTGLKVANKTSDQEIQKVISLVFDNGITFKDACLEVGRHQSVMSKIIRNMGYTIPKETGKSTRKELPTQEIIEMYKNGISELAIAKKIGVSRCAIRQRLNENNVEIRTPSEASSISAKQFTPEQRKARAKKANDTLRGAKQPISSRIKRAKHIERNTMENIIGFGEIEFKNELERKSITHIWQKAFHVYSLDFLIGNVAIELKGGSGGRGTPDIRNGRIKFLKDKGVSTLYVALENTEALIQSFDHIINLVNEMNKNPIPEGEYRVICCRFDRFEKIRNSLGRFDCVPCEPKLATYTQTRKY